MGPRVRRPTIPSGNHGIKNSGEWKGNRFRGAGMGNKGGNKKNTRMGRDPEFKPVLANGRLSAKKRRLVYVPTPRPKPPLTHPHAHAQHFPQEARRIESIMVQAEANLVAAGIALPPPIAPKVSKRRVARRLLYAHSCCCNVEMLASRRPLGLAECAPQPNATGQLRALREDWQAPLPGYVRTQMCARSLCE